MAEFFSFDPLAQEGLTANKEGQVQAPDVAGVPELGSDEFDQRLMVESATNQGYVAQRAATILSTAGVGEEGISMVTSSPGLSAIVVANPQIAQKWAEQYPGPVLSTYASVDMSEFASSEAHTYSGGADALAASRQNQLQEDRGYIAAPTGSRKYGNGVIVAVDANGQKQVLFPSDPEGEIEGSPVYMDKVLNWKPKQVQRWTKILNKAGYGVSEADEVTEPFLSALQDYHYNRYKYGRVVKKGPTGGPGDEPILDKASVRQAVRGQYRRIFGDDPSDDELEDWVRFTNKVAGRMVNKGFSPDAAASAAGSRMEERIEQSPQGQVMMEQAQEDDEQGRLAGSILSLGQLLSGGV